MTKVTVRIHKPTGLEFKTKKIESDGHVTLIKDSRKKAEWRPKIESMEAKHGWFGRTKFFTDIFPFANETWTFDYESNMAYMPKWDKNTSKAYISKKILDKAGEEMKEQRSSVILYVILVMVIVSMVLNFLLSSGRLRL